MYRDDLSRPASAKVIMENVSPSPSAEPSGFGVRRLRRRSLDFPAIPRRIPPPPPPPPAFIRLIVPERSSFFSLATLDGLDRHDRSRCANVTGNGAEDEASSRRSPPGERPFLAILHLKRAAATSRLRSGAYFVVSLVDLAEKDFSCEVDFRRKEDVKLICGGKFYSPLNATIRSNSHSPT